MNTGRQLKVAMVCHFSNAEVRKYLPLSRRRMYKFFRKLLRFPEKKEGYADIAPWDTNLINCVKERNDIDLFVLSAHTGLKRRLVSFDSQSIHYSFMRCEFANLLKIFLPSVKIWWKWNPLTSSVHRLIERIHPDIILLVGAENAYYSSTVLAIKNYPVYVLCQNVINNPEYKASGSKNAITELEIVRRVQYMAVYCRKHYDLLRSLGYGGYLFKFDWPVTSKPLFTATTDCKKAYDFVNFALHMSEEKGYHDCIKALALVKKHFPGVKLCLVDGGNDTVRDELKKLVLDLELTENVFFIPFFAERKDLFKFLQTVRFAVLPCKIDHISGTQLQSMKYGLPVVCYKTTGTPSINKNKECVLISEMNDIEDLASKMLILLQDSKKADELRNNAKEFMEKRRTQALQNMQNLIDNFKSIIDNYHLGLPIPEEQLFEPRAD